MDRTEELQLAAAKAAVMAVVGDLTTYPRWLDLVRRVEPADPEADGRPAWHVELRAKVGPLARSKRLRMVRTALDHHHVAFERQESDGRPHAPWILSAEVDDDGAGSRLTMRLHYGGSLWGPLLDRLLADAVQRGRTTLPQVVSGT